MNDLIFESSDDSTLVIVLNNGKKIRFKPPCNHCDDANNCCFRYEIFETEDKYNIQGLCVYDGRWVDPQQSGDFKKNMVSGYYDE